jgi:hypothetical protein
MRTSSITYLDQKPEPPPNRVELTGFGSLFFNSMAECNEYLAEPLWRRILGRTKYQRRLAEDQNRLTAGRGK